MRAPGIQDNLARCIEEASFVCLPKDLRSAFPKAADSVDAAAARSKDCKFCQMPTFRHHSGGFRPMAAVHPSPPDPDRSSHATGNWRNGPNGRYDKVRKCRSQRATGYAKGLSFAGREYQAPGTAGADDPRTVWRPLLGPAGPAPMTVA